MKKVLLATTALVFSAGFAAADGHTGLSLSGSANAGLKYNSEAADEVTLHHEINMVITGVGMSDNGLEFGAFIELDEDVGDQPADAEAYLSGVFGTITVGAVDPATDGFGIADVGFDGIGIDDPAEALKNGTVSADIVYSYSASGLTFTASGGVDTEGYAVALEYATDMFNVGVGYADAPAGGTVNLDELNIGDVVVPVDNSTITVVAGITQGPISANAIYSDWSASGFLGDGATAYGLDVSFDAGAATVTGAYSNLSLDGGGPGVQAYGIGVNVPLGGGLAVGAGVGILDVDGFDNATVADLGVTMSF